MVDLYRKWQRKIEHEEKEHATFREKAEDALKVYEADKGKYDKEKTRFPILRNVVEVQTGLITSKQPQAKLSKRFDNDQTQICMKLEKAVNYFVETGSMQSEATEAFEDFLTAGLGGLRIMYDDDGVEIDITEQQAQDPMTGQVYIEQVEQEHIVNQRLWAQRFEWASFHWEACARWSECDWIAFSKNMTLLEFRKEYKVYPSKYIYQDESGEKRVSDKADIKVYEIWDKLKRKRYFWSDMHDQILDEDDDPFGHDSFYPCAEPMFFGTLHDSYEPRPEFFFWSDIHNKVQKLTARESNLIDGIVDLDFFDKDAFTDVVKLETAVDGDKIPVDLSKYTVDGSTPNINNHIVARDHSGRVAVLDKITMKRDELLDKIYQTTGIADIMQGISDPRETARAQGYKNSWGNARLARKRYIFDNHIRSTLEVMINIMVKTFTAENLSQAAGMPFTQEEYDYLTNTDEYRIDVETLSTLSVDKDRDQQNAMDLTTAIAGLFSQGAAIPAPLMQGVLKNMIKAFPDSREFEESLNTLPQYLDQVQQLQGQLQQMGQQMQEIQNQNIAMANELNNYNQVKAQKDMAEAAKKVAETEGVKVETAQKANEMMVPPTALMDERIAFEQQPVQFNP